MSDENIKDLLESAWKERVYIETTEHIVRGYVFMPKIGKRSRILSEILNTNKHFIAVKECEMEYKLFPQKAIDRFDFIQLNLSSILIMRPLDEYGN